MEKFLIEHCSPTLASLKAGNLVNVSKYEIENASKSIEELNEKLNKKGVNVRIVKESNTRILVSGLSPGSNPLWKNVDMVI